MPQGETSESAISSNMSVSGKSVADIAGLGDEWDPENDLRPEEVAAGSHVEVAWRCSAGHRFRVSPNLRTNNQRASGGYSPCAECVRETRYTWERAENEMRAVIEAQGHFPTVAWLREHAFGKLYTYVNNSDRGWQGLKKALGQPGKKTIDDVPGLADEWNAGRNEKTAGEVAAWSAKPYWWICADGHEFRASPKDRVGNALRGKLTRKPHFSQCPDCREGNIVRVSDIADLVAEWDFNRNDVPPSTVNIESTTKVWWRCTEGHEFERTPRERTHHQDDKQKCSPCPLCRSESFYTWERVIAEVTEVGKEQGFMMPTSWFQANGKGALVASIRKFGKTWDDVEEAVGLPRLTSFVKSRNGIRWNSRPEAAVSNFLYFRRIDHEKGHEYPPEYAEQSGRTSGFYDLHFRDRNGREINVEVWGDNPGGRSAKEYAKGRKAKERFHEGRLDFLAIHHTDAYQERELLRLFSKHIDVPARQFVEMNYDHQFETTELSNVDEVIERYVRIASEELDGVLPSIQWLKKEGSYRGRPGKSEGNLVFLTQKHIGGIEKLYQILAQDEKYGAAMMKRMARRRMSANAPKAPPMLK